MTMMSDIIVVEDRVDMQCVRHVHLMSNAPLPAASPQMAPFGRNLGGEWVKDAGVWHWRAEYPYRGAMDFHCEGWKKFRRLVVWSLDGCGSVREAMNQAEVYFWTAFHFRPAYVFMRGLPSVVEHGQEVDDLVVLEAEWMLERCVAVGGRSF